MAESNQSATAATQQQAYMEIQKIYLKDVSYESPHAPGIFTAEWKPEINIHLSTENAKLTEDVYEVVLLINVTAKQQDKTAFLVEIKQAGVFTLRNFSKEQMGQMLGSYCPNALFPFAREAAAELIQKGGFPQLLLTPVNFDALYAQQLQNSAEAKSNQTADTKH